MNLFKKKNICLYDQQMWFKKSLLYDHMILSLVASVVWKTIQQNSYQNI